MKTVLVTFQHSENGVSLYVVPQTDAELELLKAIWRGGKLKMTNSPGEDSSGLGFAIQWRFKRDE